MKYLLQFGIITAICFVSELLHTLIPLPVPASVYGLVILFLLLLTGLLKVSQIEDVSAFFMAILPVLFVSPSVSLITSADIIMENLPYEYIRWIVNKDVNPKELDLASDTKRIQDLKGNHLLLFTSYWSIDWALEHNKGLELREFGTDW